MIDKTLANLHAINLKNSERDLKRLDTKDSDYFGFFVGVFTVLGILSLIKVFGV